MTFSYSAAFPPTPAVGFSGSPLDRADHIRRDPAALVAARADPRARWLLFDGLNPVMAVEGDGLDLQWLYRSDLPDDVVSVFLGVDAGDAPRFAASGSAADCPGRPVDARAAAMQLGDGRAAIIAHGRALIDWHARHGFCANCAAPTRLDKGGHARRCDACGAEHFPRTDPVVIMLAIKDDHALVGRQPRFPPRFLSALAGFVEPGETIEEAVARELFEEAGIGTRAVRYIASQPWPFPSSLMIGAFAEATGFELQIDGDELEEARWVTKPEVRAALAGTGDWLAPPPLAIAHTLLHQWANVS